MMSCVSFLMLLVTAAVVAEKDYCWVGKEGIMDDSFESRKTLYDTLEPFQSSTFVTMLSRGYVGGGVNAMQVLACPGEHVLVTYIQGLLESDTGMLATRLPNSDYSVPIYFDIDYSMRGGFFIPPFNETFILPLSPRAGNH